MTVYSHFGYVAIQSFLAAPIELIVQDLAAAGEEVVRFSEDGSVAAAGADGNVERLEFMVPHLPGMTELAVQRADVTLSGRRVDQEPSATAKSDSSASLTLSGRKGGLRRVDLTGLAVTPPSGKSVRLSATSGSPGLFHWRQEDSDVVFDRAGEGSDRQLHLMIRPQDTPGNFTSPQTAAPGYDMPDQDADNPLYGPVLAGATLQLDVPTMGAARLELSPPVESGAVQIFLGHNDETGKRAGLPHEADGVGWTATEIVGLWAIGPSEVAIDAVVGDAASIRVADFPGEFPQAATLVDFTPAARSLLASAYDSTGTGDLRLTLDATSTSAGELHATALRLTAHYLLESIDGDGVPVTLRGNLETAAVPVVPGLIPHRLELTVDGRFGPGVLAADSDRDRPGRRAGVRVTGPIRAMRRVDLTMAERARPLFRVGVLGRATEPSEVILQLHRDRGGRCGPALGHPVGIRVEPSPEPAWHRAELALPTDPAAVDAVWLVAHASTGGFWWYADGDHSIGTAEKNPDRLARVSIDGGSSWGSIAARPCAQIHYLSERPEPGRLAVHSPLGQLTTDLLSLPARKSRVETTGLESLERGLQVTGAGELAIAVGEPTTVTALAEAPASVTFRKEGLEPLTDAQRPEVAALGESLVLTFSSDRDVDFRVLDARITYHPWQARPTAAAGGAA